MSTHRFHPDPERNDPPDAALFDDCERCWGYDDEPWTLDEIALRKLSVLPSARATATEVLAVSKGVEALMSAEVLTEGGWHL